MTFGSGMLGGFRRAWPLIGKWGLFLPLLLLRSAREQDEEPAKAGQGTLGL